MKLLCLQSDGCMGFLHTTPVNFHYLSYSVVPWEYANAHHLATLKQEHGRPLIKTPGAAKAG